MTTKTFSNLTSLAQHLDTLAAESGDGRKEGLARTLREYEQILDSCPGSEEEFGFSHALKAAFSAAGEIQGEGAVGARAATCREIASMLMGTVEWNETAPRTVVLRKTATAVWEHLARGFEKKAAEAPPEAKGRYEAIVATLRREVATF